MVVVMTGQAKALLYENEAQELLRQLPDFLDTSWADTDRVVLTPAGVLGALLGVA